MQNCDSLEVVHKAFSRFSYMLLIYLLLSAAFPISSNSSEKAAQYYHENGKFFLLSMVVTPLKKKNKEEHPKKKYRELEGCAASTPTSIYLELEINFPGEVIVRTERKLVFSFSRSKAVTMSAISFTTRA